MLTHLFVRMKRIYPLISTKYNFWMNVLLVRVYQTGSMKRPLCELSFDTLKANSRLTRLSGSFFGFQDLFRRINSWPIGSRLLTFSLFRLSCSNNEIVHADRKLCQLYSSNDSFIHLDNELYFKRHAAWVHYFEIDVLFITVRKIVIFHNWVVHSLPNFLWILCDLLGQYEPYWLPVAWVGATFRKLSLILQVSILL